MSRTHSWSSAGASVVVLLAGCWGCGSSSSNGAAPTDAVSTSSPQITDTVAPAGSVIMTTEGVDTSPSTSSPPGSTAAPSSTLNPFQSVGEAYLALRDVDKADTEAAYMSAGPNGALPWEDTPAFCAGLVVIDTTYRDALAAIAWPTEVVEQSDQLAVALAVRIAAYGNCAASPGTFEAQSEPLDAIGGANQAVDQAQKKLHYALNLPFELR